MITYDVVATVFMSFVVVIVARVVVRIVAATRHFGAICVKIRMLAFATRESDTQLGRRDGSRDRW